VVVFHGICIVSSIANLRVFPDVIWLFIPGNHFMILSHKLIFCIVAQPVEKFPILNK
jgi:hypothetical protein